jgi:hypothetical protein
VSITPDKISAVIVTFGDRPEEVKKIAEALPYDEVLIYDNAVEETDFKFFGQYIAAARAKHDTIYFQDDDLIFSKHEELMALYEPDRFISNMSESWITDMQYWDLAFTGAGSLVPRKLIWEAYDRWRSVYPVDEDFYREAAMIFGALMPYKRVDLGFEILEAASNDNRMWKQDWHQTLKREMLDKARKLRTVCLCMMVKNEAEGIQNALRSAAGLFDKALILDTGSTDDTVQIATDVLSDMRIPSHVAQETFEPWDWATARNRSLELARRSDCDYIMLMDGDETFEPAGQVERPLITHDCMLFDYQQDISVPQPRMVRSWQPWEYRGRVHATLYCDEMRFAALTKTPMILHHGITRHYEEKLLTDVETLREMLRDDPYNTRTIFNLAKALEGLGQIEEACSLFWRRAHMNGGAEEEGWYAQYKYGALTAEITSFELGAYELLGAWRRRPTRADPLRALAQYCTKVADAMPIPEGECFFMQRSQYKQQVEEDSAKEGETDA